MAVNSGVANVVIVGAGVQGMFCALNLAASGVEGIVVVDRRFGAGGVSSSRSASMITRLTMDEYLSELATESMALYERLDEIFEGASFTRHIQRSGFALVASGERHRVALEAHRQELLALGAEVYAVEGSDLAEGSGILKLDDDAFCLVCEDDGWINLDPFLAELRSACWNRGVQFLMDTAVEDILVSASNEVAGVVIPEGQIAARTIVNAAGIFAGTVAGFVGREVSIDASLKNLVLVPGARMQGPIVESLDDSYYYRPHRGGVLVGVGEGEIIDPLEVLLDPEPGVDMRRLEECKDHLREHTTIPHEIIEKIAPGQCHAGYRPMPGAGFAARSDRTSAAHPFFGHPDGTPDGYFESSGWGEFGITLGPIGGRLTAESIRSHGH